MTNQTASNTTNKAKMKSSENGGRTGSNSLIYVVLVLGTFVMVFPFVWMVSTSLKPDGTLMTIPPQIIPEVFDWANYAEVWVGRNFSRYTFNSIFVLVFDLLGMLLSCALVAYGLAMFKFKGKNLIFIAMLATLVMPGQATLVPTYFIWSTLGLLDTFYPLILPSFFGKAFGIFLIHQYFKSLPRELYDAAWVDGANPFQIFYKIYLPLAMPALGTLAIFTFISSWNDTIGPLIYLVNNKLYTLPVALLYLHGDTYTDMTVVMAGSVITTLPVIVVFILAQKYFIKGIAAGGVKG